MSKVFSKINTKKGLLEKNMKAYVQGTMYGFYLPCTTNTSSEISSRN